MEVWPAPGESQRTGRLVLRQCLQAVQEHHEGEAVRYEVPFPVCAPDSALGPGGLYVNVRVPGLVRLKPGDLIRGAWGDLLQGHPPVSEQDYR